MGRINNDYDAIAHLWWSEDEGDSASLRYLINPVRFNYFYKCLKDQNQYANKNALDVGCGGGLLAEELAKIGLDVTGVDSSEKSIRIAQKHASDSGLTISYRQAHGEHLPFNDNTFDMVFCCDVLEHVDDAEKLVCEISRVLKAGGLFFFDTINRTLQSKIGIIYLMQKCRFTAFVRSNTHVWEMFIKPYELKTILSQNNIVLNDVKGIAPQNHNPLTIISNFYNASRKKITYQELARRLNFTQSPNLDSSYMGYGTKRNCFALK